MSPVAFDLQSFRPRPEFVRIAGNIAAITEQELCNTFLLQQKPRNRNWYDLKKEENSHVVGAEGSGSCI